MVFEWSWFWPFRYGCCYAVGFMKSSGAAKEARILGMLLQAAKNGTLSKHPALLSYKNLRKVGSLGYSPLDIAAMNGNLEQIPKAILARMHLFTLGRLERSNQAGKERKEAIAAGDAPF